MKTERMGQQMGQVGPDEAPERTDGAEERDQEREGGGGGVECARGAVRGRLILSRRI
jgi:hypothetical protein